MVVGGGVMGAAAARAVAAQGRSVLVLERFQVGHDRGSSHGDARIFRLSYHDRRYVRMAEESLPLWRDLEAETGTRLLRTTGGLDVGTAVADHAAALAAEGAAYQVLSSAEVLGRFGVRVGGDALFQPDAGVVDAEGAWRAFLDAAVAHGAEVREGAVVSALDSGPDAVTVCLANGGDLRASVAVVTAGAWARPLLATAGIELDVRPTRETVAYFSVPDASALPTLVDWGEPAVYSLPAPGDAVKVGEHRAGPGTDPDGGAEPDAGSVRRLSAWMAERFPGVAERPHRVETCLYTNTPEADFVLERHGAIVVGLAVQRTRLQVRAVDRPPPRGARHRLKRSRTWASMPPGDQPAGPPADPEEERCGPDA
ncbi:MAG: FAD-dependent oxidoreductase [Actinomycetota bacterium]